MSVQYLREIYDSNLWEETRDVHNEDKVEFGYELDKIFKTDVLTMKLDEAIRISGEEGNLLNDKFSWVRPPGVAIYFNRI